jgi:hypothetical protein
MMGAGINRGTSLYWGLIGVVCRECEAWLRVMKVMQVGGVLGKGVAIP